MTDKEIRIELTKFADRIFSMASDEAPIVKKEYDRFCKENNVTVEQLQSFAESGAGEILYMMTR